MNCNIFRKFYHRPTKKESKRLDMAERPINFREDYFNEFLKSLSQEDFICYPSEEEYQSLTDRIAKVNKLNPDQICLGSGSDSLIKDFFNIRTRRCSYFVSSFPCFPMYSVYGDMFDIYMEKIEFDRSLNIYVEDIIKKVTRECAFVVLANPNSPFGDHKTKEEIRYLLEHLKALHIPLLLDEAYVDFADYSCIDLINEFKNLYVLRTFSKAWGGAGARCGYIASCPDNIKGFQNIRNSFVLTGPTIKYINWLLDHSNLKEIHLSQLKYEKNKIIVELNDRYKIINGHTNWIHIKDIDDSCKLSDHLKSYDISYKDNIDIPFHGDGWSRVCIFNGLFKILKYE